MAGFHYQFTNKEELIEHLRRRAKDLRNESVGATKYRQKELQGRAFEIEQIIMILENSNVIVDPDMKVTI